MFDSLYKEEILEHYKNPSNFGALSSYTTSAKQVNPFCGDEIEIFIKLRVGHSGRRSRIDSGVVGTPQNDENSIMEDIGFVGKGCAISIASASMLTEFAKGKTKQELTKFSENDMLGLLGVDVSETRKKCALLAHAVLHDCLQSV